MYFLLATQRPELRNWYQDQTDLTTEAVVVLSAAYSARMSLELYRLTMNNVLSFTKYSDSSDSILHDDAHTTTPKTELYRLVVGHYSRFAITKCPLSRVHTIQSCSAVCSRRKLEVKQCRKMA